MSSFLDLLETEMTGQPVPPGKLPVTVTYLEKITPPGERAPCPVAGIEIVQAAKPSVAFYRYLYATVGEPWLWSDRRALSDDALAAIINHPKVELLVVLVDGHPGGYGELDFRRSDAVGIAYFGLFPQHTGRGIGPWMLDRLIAKAWRRHPGRLRINTCTFDHPKALGLYQSRGFVEVRQVHRQIDDPRLTGLLPRTAAPQIPLAREA